MDIGLSLGLTSGTQQPNSAGPAPLTANGLLPDLDLLIDVAMAAADLSVDFTGPDLSFALAPASATLPSGLSLSSGGVLSGTPDTVLGPLSIIVRASNTQGFVDSAFSLTVLESVLSFDAMLSNLTNNPTHGPSAETAVPLSANASNFSDTPPASLSYQWKTVESGNIAGATAATYTPNADLYDGESLYCSIAGDGYPETNTNQAVIRHVPPAASQTLMDEILDQNTGVQVLPTAQDFTGEALVFAVAGGGATINAATGDVSLPTITLRNGETVTVTATNSGGSATSAFQVTVEAAAGADVNAAFGALTRAGAGGVDVTGTSIVTGDASNHWQISAGTLRPSSSGEGAITGTYDLTLNNGETVDITVEANVYSVASMSELTAAYDHSALGAGATIKLRDGDYSGGETTLAARAFTTPLTIESEFWIDNADPRLITRGATVGALIFAENAQNVTLQALRLRALESEVVNTVSVVNVFETSQNITIHKCEIWSRSFEEIYDAGDFADNSSTMNTLRGVFANSSSGAHNRLRITENHIHDVLQGVHVQALRSSNGDGTGDPGQINSNIILDAYGSFTVLGSRSNGWEINDNFGLHVWAAEADTTGAIPASSPHSSTGLSFDSSDATDPVDNGVIMGNRMHVGWHRTKYAADKGDPAPSLQSTGMKFNDPGQSFAYRNLTIAHNLIVSHGISCELSGAQNISIYNNTLAYEDYTGLTGTPTYYFQGAENVRAWNNIGPLWALGSNDGATEGGVALVATVETMQAYGNFAAGLPAGGALAWNAVFAGPFGEVALEAVEAAYTPVPGSYALTASQKKGACGTGYWDGISDTAPAWAPPNTSSVAPYAHATTGWSGGTYASRGGALTGATDGRFITLAWQGAFDASIDGQTWTTMIGSAGGRFGFTRRFTDGIRFGVEDAAGADLWNGDIAGIDLSSSAGTIALAAAFDMNTGRVIAAINGKPVPLPFDPSSAVTFGDIDITASNVSINADTSGGAAFEGTFDAAMVHAAFIDLETTAGIEAIFASDGKLRDLSGLNPLVLVQGRNAAAMNSGSINSGSGGAFSVSSGSVSDVSGGSGGNANVMAGIGDFSSDAGWTLETDLVIAGGILSANTTQNFRAATRLGGNRVPVSAGKTLDLEFNMVSLTEAKRLRIHVEPYDAGGVALGSSTTIFDSNSDGTVVAGLNSKAGAYTTPAAATTLEVTLEFTLSGFVGEMDDLKLIEQ